MIISDVSFGYAIPIFKIYKSAVCIPRSSIRMSTSCFVLFDLTGSILSCSLFSHDKNTFELLDVTVNWSLILWSQWKRKLQLSCGKNSIRQCWRDWSLKMKHLSPKSCWDSPNLIHCNERFRLLKLILHKQLKDAACHRNRAIADLFI